MADSNNEFVRVEACLYDGQLIVRVFEVFRTRLLRRLAVVYMTNSHGDKNL